MRGTITSALRRLALGAVAAAAMAGASMAATVDFAFSFENTPNGGGTVTGIVRGLDDSGTSAASSVEILTNTAGFGVGEYVGQPLTNSWTVSQGVLTSVSFLSYGALNDAPDVTGSSLLLNSGTIGVGTSVFGGLTNSGSLIRSNDLGPITAVFTLVAPAVIPLPASGWLLLAALGGAAGLSRRRAARAA